MATATGMPSTTHHHHHHCGEQEANGISSPSRKRSNASRELLLMTFAPSTDYGSPPGFSRSPSLPLSRSPDLASPVYPDRAIRPLPKSRLKSKLSPEQASTIIFPPDPPPISPTLNFSSHDGGGRMTNGDVAHGHYLHHHPHDGVRRDVVHDHCTCGEDGDSGDDEVEFDNPDYRYAAPPGATNGDGSMVRNVQQRLMDAARVPTKPPPPGSAASSADGYESFENTSNKKKRKIPLSSASSMHQSQLSAEMASMGISGGVDRAADDGGVAVQSYAPTASGNGSGTGISGAGRGRYGRQSARGEYGVRRPLGSSNMNAVNGYRTLSRDIKGLAGADAAAAGIENTGGIISQAIKSAAEQAPLTPQKGQDSTSLLQSAASNSAGTPSSSKTQFTFAVESESATKMVDQQAAAAAQHAAYSQAAATRAANGQPANGAARGHLASQGTQTTPSRRQTAHPNAPNQVPANAARPPPNAPPGNQQQAVPPPKPRRRNPNREYAQQARQRRLQQEYTNYHHRPNRDNMWICEFCEYEDIFGVPPVALIRQYEIKDRQERKRAAERRRLLEKARAKGRKNKKGSKKATNNATVNAAAQQAPAGGVGGQYDANHLPPPGEDPEYYDDDEYADEYGDGDEYEPVGPGGTDEFGNQYYPPPPPAPVGTLQSVGDGGRGGG